jgi:hypothetical protein
MCPPFWLFRQWKAPLGEVHSFIQCACKSRVKQVPCPHAKCEKFGRLNEQLPIRILTSDAHTRVSRIVCVCRCVFLVIYRGKKSAHSRESEPIFKSGAAHTSSDNLFCREKEWAPCQCDSHYAAGNYLTKSDPLYKNALRLIFSLSVCGESDSAGTMRPTPQQVCDDEMRRAAWYNAALLSTLQCYNYYYYSLRNCFVLRRTQWVIYSGAIVCVEVVA